MWEFNKVQKLWLREYWEYLYIIRHVLLILSYKCNVKCLGHDKIEIKKRKYAKWNKYCSDY